MDDQISNLILEELRGLRTEVTDGFSETKQRLTAVETQIAPFFANDGEKAKMQDEIDKLKQIKWYGIGFIGALSLAGNYLMRKIGL